MANKTNMTATGMEFIECPVCKSLMQYTHNKNDTLEKREVGCINEECNAKAFVVRKKPVEVESK